MAADVGIVEARVVSGPNFLTRSQDEFPADWTNGRGRSIAKQAVLAEPDCVGPEPGGRASGSSKFGADSEI